jgi:ribosome-binding protein aMBF1 (putative translation factor)
MSASTRSENQDTLPQESRFSAMPSPAFGRDVAAKIGNRVAARRSLCGLSKLQLAARLGIGAADVSAYEQGEKRMSCALLLDTAKQLKATPRFFFQ